MQGDMLRYYSRNQFFLSQMGIWPYQPKVIKILLPCFLVGTELSVLATQILLLYNTWGDLSMTVEGIINIILLIGATTKLVNVVINNKKMQYLLQLMDQHWRLFHNEYELHILRRYAKIGYKITKYYSMYINIFAVMFMLIPLLPKVLDVIIPLNESRPVIYIVEGDWGVDKDEYYYPILLHCYLAVIISTRCMVNVDSMYMVCVLHGCSLFNAIGIRLESILDKAKLVEDEKIMSKKHVVIKKHDSEDYHEMILCLKKHQIAIKYIHILDSTFKSATFIILFLNVMILSLIGLQLLNKLGQIQEVIRFGFIAIGSITHLMSMCLPGQLLLDKSIEVFDRAYSAQWYMFSLKTTKLLSILLYRSLVPCTLSAANMFIMSMSMFSSVMQTAMSYFTTFLSSRNRFTCITDMHYMQGDMLRYYSRNQRFWLQMGIWPYQPRIIKILLPSFLVAVEISGLATQVMRKRVICANNCVRLLYNTYQTGDVTLAVEGILNVILLVGATAKLVNVVINNKRMQYLLQMMDQHWRLFHSEYELRILRRYANIGYKITKYYSVYINIFAVMFMLIPLLPKILDVIIPLNESRPVIYIVEGDWGVDKEEYFYPILLHCYICIVISTRCMVNVDSMYIVCVLHGCSLFNAIGIGLANIIDEAKLVKGEETMSKKHLVIKEHHSKDYCEMIVCLKKHQIAIKFVNVLDSAFQIQTFFILSLNVMILSLIGLQLLNKLGQTQEVIRYSCIAIGSVTHLLSMCFPGQLLVDTSMEVFDKAYSSRWYMFSLKTSRLLSILLYKSITPCTLTAANMYTMSMTTFSSVMQTAMSYFTTFMSVS
ncbi:uncharacterized protein [Anoplolepis gracilipes]|uniref:uncharacterized protein n=1 Tax=Anoplolepis gracilipes TaxID=354296 RepID=UPI003BA3D670